MSIFILNIFRKAPAISKTGEPGAFHPLAVQAVPSAANYMPSVLFFNVVSVPRIGTAGLEPVYHLLTPLSRLGWRAFPLGYVPKIPGDLSRSGSAM